MLENLSEKEEPCALLINETELYLDDSERLTLLQPPSYLNREAPLPHCVKEIKSNVSFNTLQRTYQAIYGKVQRHTIRCKHLLSRSVFRFQFGLSSASKWRCP